MLVSADWVLPVDAMPIRGGAVRVHNGKIAEVGRPEDLQQSRPRIEFRGCALLPGLVDAHTHLSHGALDELLPPAPLPEYVDRLAELSAHMDADDVASSAAYAALRRLESGTTVVGDFAYGPEAPAAAADIGLGGVFYWQVDGVHGAELPRMLERAEFPHTAGPVNARTRYGLTPDAPYAAGRSLLRAVLAEARAEGLPLAVHVGETADESQLLADGSGPLAPVAERLAVGFHAPARSPVAYLASLGLLDGALAVHCAHLAPGEAQLLALRTRGVVVCPRTNKAMHDGEPPVERLLRAKATLGLGTDRAFGAQGCDLFAEARALQDIDPSLTASRLLRIVTLDGAAALGVGALFGSLTPGKQADLTVVRIPPTDEPAAAVMRHGGAESVEAVMSAGIWRIREKRPTFPAAPVLREAEAVRARLAEEV